MNAEAATLQETDKYGNSSGVLLKIRSGKGREKDKTALRTV